MNKLNQFEVAYLAGIVDGEGCISINKAKPRGRSKNPCHVLRITIANTNRDLINWLAIKMGGCSRKSSRAKYPANWKDSWQWHIEGFPAMELLCLVEPHLIIKKAQAIIAIEFQKKKSISNGKVLPEEEVFLRDGFRNRLMNLNKKGKVISSVVSLDNVSTSTPLVTEMK